jgi:hypothetical protein
MPNRTEARSAKADLTTATGRLPRLRLFSTPLVDPDWRSPRSLTRSMSSIKRDVKKKLLRRPESRCFLEIQPTVIRLRWRSMTCAHSDQSPLVS